MKLEQIWQEYAPLYAKFTPSMQEQLLDLVAMDLTGKILDSGCGVGKLISYLDSNKVDDYVGVDMNSEMLKYAKKNSNFKKNCEFVLGDATNLEFGTNNFDAVTSVNVLYAVNDPLEALRQAHTVLKKGGRFELASPNENLDVILLQELNKKDLLQKYDKKDVLRYFEINDILAGQNPDFKPHLFSQNEITSLLSEIGFEIQSTRNAYYGQLFHISSIKK